MGMNAPTPPQTGVVAWIENHPTVALAGAMVLAIVGGGIFLSRNKAQTPATPALSGDLSGLATDANGNHIVYRDAADTFYNYSDIQGSYNTTSTTTTPAPVVVPPVVIDPQEPPPHHGHPIPSPAPPPRVTPPPSGNHPRRIWDQHHAIGGGETLSSIAAGVSAQMKQQGSGSVGVTWMEIYQHNQATIDAGARAHGNPIAGGPWNNVFPGEVVIVPRWYVGP